MTRDVDGVLFDLGGVLIGFGGVQPMADLAGIDEVDVLWERWLSSPWVRAYESGQCSSVDFAVGMVDEWQLAVTPEAFLDEFRCWPGDLLPGAQVLVASVRDDLVVGCLSNTNTTHWNDRLCRLGVEEMFDHIFLSHRTGLIKPDPDVFEHVCSSLALAPNQVLFLDDNVLNVDAARTVGLHAERVQGVDQARSVLHEHELID